MKHLQQIEQILAQQPKTPKGKGRYIPHTQHGRTRRCSIECPPSDKDDPSKAAFLAELARRRAAKQLESAYAAYVDSESGMEREQAGDALVDVIFQSCE